MKITKKEFIDELGYRIIQEFNLQKQLIKETVFCYDYKTIWVIDEFDPKTGHKTKETWFNDDGKTIETITEYAPQTGYKTKQTYFHSDGKTIWFIEEFDQNGNYLTIHHSNTDYVKNEQKKYK